MQNVGKVIQAYMHALLGTKNKQTQNWQMIVVSGITAARAWESTNYKSWPKLQSNDLASSREWRLTRNAADADVRFRPSWHTPPNVAKRPPVHVFSRFFITAAKHKHTIRCTCTDQGEGEGSLCGMIHNVFTHDAWEDAPLIHSAGVWRRVRRRAVVSWPKCLATRLKRV